MRRRHPSPPWPVTLHCRAVSTGVIVPVWLPTGHAAGWLDATTHVRLCHVRAVNPQCGRCSPLLLGRHVQVHRLEADATGSGEPVPHDPPRAGE